MLNNNGKTRPGLPAKARLAFTGELFEVWQWDQEMFDGSQKVFEKVWRRSTVEIIATVGQQIIIEEQEQPERGKFISLPSGMVDDEENILEEAKRELLEETGYVSQDWKLWFKQQAKGKIIWDVNYFIAKDCNKVQEASLDSGEKIIVKLISFEEFINLTEEPKFRVSPEFVNFLLRLQTDKNKKEEFRKTIFNK